jgi:hypothetical protein
MDFSSFPPHGLHLQQTYLWLYMPFILQAANKGTPIINLNIAPQHQELWDRWVQILLSQRDLPDLQYLIPLFNGLCHLSAVDQSIIISDASKLLGQEIQEFIGSFLGCPIARTHCVMGQMP